jgi:hypothetical protein
MKRGPGVPESGRASLLRICRGGGRGDPASLESLHSIETLRLRSLKLGRARGRSLLHLSPTLSVQDLPPANSEAMLLTVWMLGRGLNVGTRVSTCNPGLHSEHIVH